MFIISAIYHESRFRFFDLFIKSGTFFLLATFGLAIFFVYASFYGPREFEAAGDPWRAIRMLQHAARVNPEDARVYRERARLYSALGRPEEARRVLREGVEAGALDDTGESPGR